MSKLLYFVSEDWYFCSHRLELAKAAVAKGYDVSILCNVNRHRSVIEEAGIRVIPMDIDRANTGLLANLMLLLQVIKIFLKEKPDVVHNVAQKPVLMGTIAAHLCGAKRIVNALGGLGFVFMSKTTKAKILKYVMSTLYKLLFNLRRTVLILQNRDDYQFFVETIGVKQTHLCLIRGAGINIEQFSHQPFPNTDKVRFTLVARMLKDKGVGEFLQAAKRVSDKLTNVEFVLVGDVDAKNPNAFTENELTRLAKDAGVIWDGPSSQIFDVWKHSHVSVLPSYREGLPKSLLESASVGRPIITTDVPGCREVVEDGKNGFLVPLYDVQTLAEKIQLLAENKSLRQEMGEISRKMAEEEFASHKVNEKTIHLYEQ
ncbi:glycosyltransferase family 4 protein [Alteromonas sp. a30]|uniref:glycosyltransferase family 4 protein n=1 Tax=Alteromonas sp. a30 TaxID=2730917 RepID=UPI002282C48E|nr:glycosyltransferase family 4 protein [Alteromonas sp. a30]MCY7294345.1 glycosyltransferase family 4 protein [Alteromonas sp. a30]